MSTRNNLKINRENGSGFDKMMQRQFLVTTTTCIYLNFQQLLVFWKKALSFDLTLEFDFCGFE